MNKMDFDWLAGVLASLRANDRITDDGLKYVVERLAIRYEKFDQAAFNTALSRYILMFRR